MFTETLCTKIQPLLEGGKKKIKMWGKKLDRPGLFTKNCLFSLIKQIKHYKMSLVLNVSLLGKNSFFKRDSDFSGKYMSLREILKASLLKDQC
jgi:hypothetical protein